MWLLNLYIPLTKYMEKYNIGDICEVGLHPNLDFTSWEDDPVPSPTWLPPPAPPDWLPFLSQSLKQEKLFHLITWAIFSKTVVVF